ncbi:MAG: hypothetical protein JOZ78_26155 [Chroococcidiopsidaceae cyanobacterium CP_BM_ER_R8_30]|nr:hypothetical protein [Chroococcidiopsidaceae cyanobacterium CP_BM_ER_R8_30]
MTSVFHVDIQESETELKELMGRQTKARLRDRVRALYLCKTGQVQQLEKQFDHNDAELRQDHCLRQIKAALLAKFNENFPF